VLDIPLTCRACHLDQVGSAVTTVEVATRELERSPRRGNDDTSRAGHALGKSLRNCASVVAKTKHVAIHAHDGTLGLAWSAVCIAGGGAGSAAAVVGHLRLLRSAARLGSRCVGRSNRRRWCGWCGRCGSSTRSEDTTTAGRRCSVGWSAAGGRGSIGGSTAGRRSGIGGCTADGRSSIGRGAAGGGSTVTRGAAW